MIMSNNQFRLLSKLATNEKAMTTTQTTLFPLETLPNVSQRNNKESKAGKLGADETVCRIISDSESKQTCHVGGILVRIMVVRLLVTTLQP